MDLRKDIPGNILLLNLRLGGFLEASEKSKKL